MPEANKYVREYFLLENHNSAGINENYVAGYVKIEIKNSNARLVSVVQNAYKLNKDMQLALYMVKNKSDNDFVRLGRFEQKNDAWELKVQFDCRNILDSKLNYNEVSLFLVVEEDQKGKIHNSKNYLVAFRGVKTDIKVEKKDIQNIIDRMTYPQKIKESMQNNEEFNFLSVSEAVWDMDRLISCFNNYFEKIEPFGVSRKDYSWWKVNSTVNLNNILYQCNIKTPVMFNPLVMMAHYKYKHLIAGIYCDKNRKKEYLVFGIPGYYNVDERPFGEMCLWVGTNILKPQQDNFGYWLIYIEPKSGKFVSFG